MDYKVKHGNTYIPLNSSANKSVITAATQSRKLCGDDTVKITLQSAEYINFAIGDTIDVFGTTYTINQLPTVKRNGERDYEYTLVFEGLQYALIDRVFLMPDNTEGNNLMFDLAGMMAVLITNINRGNSGKPYVLGTCPTDTEYKNLPLSENNCLQVLQQLCQEWNTEFTIVEESNQITINIGAAGTVFGVPFTYGRNGGIYNLNREKGATDVITRLFCYGGTQNLTWYRHNRLCLPSKTKNQSYIEDSTAQATYGIKEAVKNFDEIYPNRIGEVSSVSGCAYNEFIDTSMADSQNGGFDLNAKWPNTTAGYTEWRTIKGLEDTTQNRNIYDNDVVGTTRYLINGETAKIHFNTGALAGYEIDIHSYNHTTQKFVLQPLIDENNYDFPSKTNSTFRIAAGDKYVILGINLPESYKTQAETQLATEAATYFATVCTPQPKYSLEIDSLALQRIVAGLHSDGEREVFKVGDAVHITDTDTGVDADIRIDRFERDLIDTWKYKLTLTDEVTYTSQVKTLIELNQIKRAVQESGIADPNKIRRGWKDAEELYNMVFDTEGQIYGEKIQPLSIDTTMLKVGARSQQLTLQNVTFQPNYLGDPAKFEASAGYLVHLSIDESGPKTWTMSALSASSLSTGGLYLYARCSRTLNTGTWVLSNQAITFDRESGWYNFLIGTLGSVDSNTNTRTFSPTYGFSTINGRYITTGVIKSADGSGVIIDLDNNTITGRIRFLSNNTPVDAEQYIGDSVNTAVNELRNYLLNSSFAYSLDEWNFSGGVEIYASYNSARIIGALNTTKYVYQTVDSRINTTETNVFTFSGEVALTSYATKGTTNFLLRPYYDGSGNGSWYGGTFKKFTLDGVEYSSATFGDAFLNIKGLGFKKFVFTIEIAAGVTENRFFIYARDFTGILYFRKLKLEKGETATEWSAAPEDVGNAVDTANSANNKIDNLEVGGRNLLIAADCGYRTTKSFEGAFWVTNLYTTDWCNTHLKEGEQYVLSFDAEKLTNNPYQYTRVSPILFQQNVPNLVKTPYYNNTGDMPTGVVIHHEMKFTFTPSSQTASYYGLCAYATYRESDGMRNTIRITNLKLEKGNKATDYTPAPEDAVYDDIMKNGLNVICDTAAGTAGKVINSDFFTAERLIDSNLKIRVKFTYANTHPNPYLIFQNASGTTIQPSGTNSSCGIRYNGKNSVGQSGFGYNEAPKWTAKQIVEFSYLENYTYQSSVYPIYGIDDEPAFKASLLMNNAAQGSTDIDGGLIITTAMLLRNSNREVSAGINGLSEYGVAFFAGGTLQQAMADIAKVWIKHSGEARFGAIYIDGRNTGDIRMKDADGVVRFVIKNSALTLATGSKVYNTGNSGNTGATATGTGLSNTTITSSTQTSNIFASQNLNAQGAYEFDCKITIGTLEINVGSVAMGGYYYVDIEFYNGSAWVNIASYKADARESGAVSIRDAVIVAQYKGTTNSQGYCQIGLRAKYYSSGIGGGTNPSATAYYTGITWCYYQDKGKANTQIANNGMCYFLNSLNQFVVQRNSGDTELTTTIKGKMTSPGVLWAGMVKSNGGAETAFSVAGCTITATKTATGKYSVVVNGVGSGSVSVAANVLRASSETSGWSANVIASSSLPTKSSIVIWIYKDNTLTDSNFTLTIIGNNV